MIWDLIFKLIKKTLPDGVENSIVSDDPLKEMTVFRVEVPFTEHFLFELLMSQVLEIDEILGANRTDRFSFPKYFENNEVHRELLESWLITGKEKFEELKEDCDDFDILKTFLPYQCSVIETVIEMESSRYIEFLKDIRDMNMWEGKAFLYLEVQRLEKKYPDLVVEYFKDLDTADEEKLDKTIEELEKYMNS